MSRRDPSLPVGFSNIAQVVEAIESFGGKQRFSKLADLASSTPQTSPQLLAYGAQLAKDHTRTVSLYRNLCAASGIPIDEAWCSQQESKNNNDVLNIEKDIGKAASKMEREGQIDELAKRIIFASEVGNVQDIHRFVQKQNSLCNTPELAIAAAIQTFDALLFAATWDDRDTPTAHTIAQPATRADSNATKNLLVFKEQRDGSVVCMAEGAAFDLFAEARAAAILARILIGDMNEALGLILSFPLRHDRAQIGKLESIVTRWTTPDRYASCIALVVLAFGNREDIQATVNHPEFRVLLETAPQLLDACNGVLMADFASVGKGIAFAESLARSDRFIRRQCDNLTRLIRRNLVREFVRPYKVLKLEAVAETFQMNLESVERLLADLIRKSELSARIDLNSNLLYASRQEDSDVHKASIHAANEYVRDMHQALRIQSLLQHKMTIPTKKRDSDRIQGGDAALAEMMMGGGMDFDDDEFGGGGYGQMMMMMGGGGGMRSRRGPAGGRR